MFNMFKKKAKLPEINSSIEQTSVNNEITSSVSSPSDSYVLDFDLKKNIEDFNKFIGISHDVNIRKLKLPLGKKGMAASLMFVDGLVDKPTINNSVIDPLLTELPEESNLDDLLNVISEQVIKNLKIEQSCSFSDILDKMFSGDSILFINGYKYALIIGNRKWLDRGVQEANTEQIIHGPKDSFSETLLTNTMLLRRRIKSNKLQMEYMNIGTLTKTDIIISYIDGVVNPKLVEEVRNRLNRIKTDSIIGTGMIEEFIEDSSSAILPQIIHTERPDKTTAHLLSGGVVILVDGTPLVLLLPIVFWQFLTSPEDYNERVYASFVIRSLRFVSLIIALVLPSFYIAVTSFHHEMIPFGLLQVIVSGRRDVPFPVLIEVILMELILELIREAGARLPRNVGQAISIVGALVLGQAAIQAKLASPATVTVVAITAIANFTIPTFSAALSIRSLRFILMIASGLYGILGFIATLFVMLVHLCSLRSFGVPYLAPLAPLIPGDLKDTIIRAPIWAMNKRPQIFGAINSVRQKQGLKPGLKQDGSGDQEVRK